MPQRHRLLGHPFVLAIILVVFIVGHQLGWLAGMEKTVIHLLGWPQRYLTITRNRVNLWMERRNLRQNDTHAWLKLTNAMAELQVENARLKALLSETKTLNEQLQFLDKYQYRFKTGRVIGSSPIGDQEVFLVDVGSEADITVGLPVVSGAGTLVGKVSHVEPFLAHITLITNNLSQLAATINGQTATAGIVTGEHGLTLRMELIPIEISLRVGDLLVTSGLEKNIPAGLILGEITRVELTPTGFFQTVYAKPVVPLHALNYVSIILPPNYAY